MVDEKKLFATLHKYIPIIDANRIVSIHVTPYTAYSTSLVEVTTSYGYYELHELFNAHLAYETANKIFTQLADTRDWDTVKKF